MKRDIRNLLSVVVAQRLPRRSDCTVSLRTAPERRGANAPEPAAGKCAGGHRGRRDRKPGRRQSRCRQRRAVVGDPQSRRRWHCFHVSLPASVRVEPLGTTGELDLTIDRHGNVYVALTFGPSTLSVWRITAVGSRLAQASVSNLTNLDKGLYTVLTPGGILIDEQQRSNKAASILCRRSSTRCFEG
jgi:hypothetical protein